MFIGKHREAADRMTVQIKKRTVRKEYLARVIGEFPEGEVICDKPILQISPKLGLNRVRANGKEARTVFKRLAYYPPREAQKPQFLNSTSDIPPPSTPSETTPARTSQPDAAAVDDDDDGGACKPWHKLRGYSIVRCLPLTGRTHQIRVHLQFLGHPISNDPIYANQRVFGPSLGAASTSDSDDESIMSRLMRMGKDEVAEAVAYHDEMVAAYEKRKAERMTGERCAVCGTELYSDPGQHELGIYLHALRYADVEGKWSYETGLPGWALPPEGMEGPREATKESDPLAVDLGRLGLEDGLDKGVDNRGNGGGKKEGETLA
jgi:tRNA pseudouridine synthase 9